MNVPGTSRANMLPVGDLGVSSSNPSILVLHGATTDDLVHWAGGSGLLANASLSLTICLACRDRSR